MKHVSIYFIVFLLLQSYAVTAQEEEPELPESIQQQIENETAATDQPATDDAWWQHYDYLRRHPLNLNEASEQDLAELQLLSPVQIAQFLRYRSLFGVLLSVYELQAIPGWDLHTIRKILPLITVQQRSAAPERWWQRFRNGDHQLQLRFAPAAASTDPSTDTTSAAAYPPSPYVLWRYRYHYKNRLQWGISGEKDAGEPFFTGKQKLGFDFYSFHFFVQQAGNVKALALGDFTVNLGQGLIHWQRLAFKKSASVLQIKKQSPVLRPYQSAGEFNFHRGAGITLQKGKWELTLFGSRRLFTARLKTDSVKGTFVTSWNTSGYHRSITENATKENMRTITAGGNLRYQHRKGHLGVNAVHYSFSLPFGAADQPYDHFAITGLQWMNYSIDGSLGIHNCYVFGELAVDQRKNIAALGGLLLSLDPKAALSLVYRRISPAYQTLFASAFTEQTMPGNEQGIYGGIAWQPSTQWEINAYADVYRFPWLRYRVDAPSAGSDYLVQVTHHPNKKVKLSGRFRSESKSQNDAIDDMPVNAVLPVKKSSWRGQISFQVNRSLLLQERMEWVLHETYLGGRKEKGFSAYIEGKYRWAHHGSAGLRLAYFDTDSYNARIYNYEQGIQFQSLAPALYGKGTRYNFYAQIDPAAIFCKGRRPGISCVLQIRCTGLISQQERLIQRTDQQAAGTGQRTAAIGVQLILSRR